MKKGGKSSKILRKKIKKVNPWLLLAFPLILIIVFQLYQVALFWKEISSEMFFLPQSRLISFNRFFEHLKETMLVYQDEYPIVVGEKVVTWEELEQALLFEEKLWETRPKSWQFEGVLSLGENLKKDLINRLIERKVVELLAERFDLSGPTSEELEKTAINLFGSNYQSKDFASLPEFKRILKTEVLKTKLDNEIVRRYTGALIYVKFKSWGALELTEQGIDPEQKAKEKIEELYSLAQQGKDISLIVDLANNDKEVMKLNDEAEMQEFNRVQFEDLKLPSPEFREAVKSLADGQLSPILRLKAVMDPQTNQLEEFAFGFVKLENVQGEDFENLETLINQTREQLDIKVNI
jgi:hypothetical protein